MAIIAGLIAIGGGLITFLLKIAPFASTEALAATQERINRHEVEIQIMKAIIPELDKKVDHIGEKIDSLDETWNRHIELEHRNR